jgi:transcriptional regulator with XRE-family HTH domain
MAKKHEERQLDHTIDRLKILMDLHKLSIKSFAKKIGVSNYTISNILTGINTPHIITIMAIANTFDVSLDWLCGEGEAGKPK